MSRRVAQHSNPVSDNEVQILLADLTQRQQEIIDRGRSENYLFVVLFTAIGALVAAVVFFISHKQSTFPDYLPTLVIAGALVLMCLPVNLIHIGSVTEIRRMYVQENLEPRLRELAGHAGRGGPLYARGVFSFETWDRSVHKGPFNFVIAVRSAFMSLPAAFAFVWYVVLRIQFWETAQLPLLIGEGSVFLVMCFVGWVIVRSYVRMMTLMNEAQERANERD